MHYGRGKQIPWGTNKTMTGWSIRSIALLVALLGIAGCGNSSRLSLDPSAVSPDEFLITPKRPLETPADLTRLPEPTPGSRNRTDIDPDGRLEAAFGGRATRSGNAADAVLIQAVRQRGGSLDNIRSILSAEDAALRERRAGRLKSLAEDREAGLFYRNMMLDAYAEWARLRAAGVRVPAAPPE